MLSTDWEQLEADFDRFYRSDLRMLCWGPEGTRWGVRRILNRINNLPMESATARNRMGERAGWDQQAEITAGIHDELRKLNYYFVAANGGNPDKPDFFPRPGEQQQQTTVPLSALESFLSKG